MDRSGLRLKLLKQQAKAGDLRLVFADESEALAHPCLAHPCLARAWVKRGADLRIPAPGQSKKIAMMAALDLATNHLTVTTSRSKRSSDFIDLPGGIDRLYAPRPGASHLPVVLVLDNGPVHTSKLTRAVLAERAHWLTVEWLPKYVPELNDTEPVWNALKQTELAHQTFADADILEKASEKAVLNRNREKSRLSWGTIKNI